MSVAPYTLAQLLATQGLDEIRERYLASLQGAGFPAITEWVPKDGVEMAHVNQVASFITNDLAADLPGMIASGFLGEGARPFLDLLATSVYQLDPLGSSKTTMNWDLVAAAGAGPFSWQPGDLRLIADSGNEYVSSAAATLAPGGRVTIPFAADAAGASFNDDPSTAGFQLMTSPAGVTLEVSAPTFTPIVQTSTSTGRLAPRAIGTIGTHTYIVRIDATGDPGTARWSVSVDGADFVSMGTLQSDGNAIGTATDAVLFAALSGAGSPSSFLAGETFAFGAPGGPQYVQGADDESSLALASRCNLRWQSLSRNPTNGLLIFWALRAVPQASRLALTVDPIVPGRAQMVAADSHGPLDQSALTAIVADVRARLSPLDAFNAVGARTLGVRVGGSVLVAGPDLVNVQQAAQKAWTAYLGATLEGGTVRIFDLEGILMAAGAIDANMGYDELRLNDDPSNIILDPDQIPVESESLISSMAWVTT